MTFVAFLPTLGNGFVGGWDDNTNLVDNLDYRGLGWRQLRWMFSAFVLCHYQPLTWLTFGLDYVLWGMNPVGYHLTSLMLHMATTVVFYAVAVRLLAAALPAVGDPIAAKLGAAVAAVLFAVHPLRVESVAWATERRDVLCGLFYLLAVLAYLRACKGAAGEGLWQQRWYWGAVALGGLALLSKSMAVSLPVVLLVLDVYPLGRLGGRAGWRGEVGWRVLMEKAPFVVLSGAASVIALKALDAGNVLIAQLSALDRVAISLYSLVFLLWKMVVPLTLSPLYELPVRIEPLSWPYVGAAVVVVTISATAFRLRRRCPGLAAVWVSYVVILLPVLGIVQNGGSQIAADRYTYVAGLGWALLAGAGMEAWVAAERRRLVRPQRAMVLGGAAVAVIAVALGALTWRQAQVWHDPKSLWTHALSTHPSAIAYHNLGVLIFRQGELAEAVRHYRQAVALKPDYAAAETHLGVALFQLGELAEATRHLRRAVDLDPESVEARTNLGVALFKQGDLLKAAEHLRHAVATEPGSAEAQYNLGLVLEGLGRQSEAIEHYRRAQKNRDQMPTGGGSTK
ncbi:MAG: tetratricopeptide repeat protein [Gemmatimonadales bacterium]